jgi:4-hydroxy-tetrahydrodipicolinate synthase
MVSAYRAGNASAALKIHQQLYPLFKDLFIETNPQPIKAALAMMGLIQEEFRLPLVPMSAKNRGVLKSTLIQCGVIRHD